MVDEANWKLQMKSNYKVLQTHCQKRTMETLETMLNISLNPTTTKEKKKRTKNQDWKSIYDDKKRVYTLEKNVLTWNLFK